MPLSRGRKIFFISLSVWLFLGMIVTTLILTKTTIRLNLVSAALVDNSQPFIQFGNTVATVGDITTITGIFGSFAGMGYLISLVAARNQ
jgi:hypothetical protein